MEDYRIQCSAICAFDVVYAMDSWCEQNIIYSGYGSNRSNTFDSYLLLL